MTANRYKPYLAKALAAQFGPNHRPTEADVKPLLWSIEDGLRAKGYDATVVERETEQARRAAVELMAAPAPGPTPPPSRSAQAQSPDKIGRPAGARRWIVRGLIALALVIAYLTPLVLFFSESGDSNPFANSDGRQLALALRIAVVDLAKENLTFQIMPAGGSLIAADGRLSRDVTVELDPGTGPMSHTFKAATPLTPWTVNATTDSGDILEYPFDSYEIDMDIEAHAGDEPLQVRTGIVHVPHGLKARHAETTLSDGGTNVTIRIKRTGTMLFVAFLATVSLFLVTCAACAVAWQVAYRGRKIEFSMMVWVAALLFVIPTVRNSLPGGVPPGALIDFVIFFWLQVATVIAMASLVLTWARRTS